MTDYSADVRKYTASVNDAAVAAIVKFCGIALRNEDSSLVSTSDKEELTRVRDGFAARKLGLSAPDADAAIARVATQMKDERRKSRVTFYYLLAETSGTLGKLA
jgi:hypothetical protein